MASVKKHIEHLNGTSKFRVKEENGKGQCELTVFCRAD